MWILLDELLDEPDDPWWDDTTTPEVEDRDTILEAALVDAEQELTELLGDDLDAWTWGALHELDLTHGTLGESGIGLVESLFNRGPVETGGSGSVVDATGWSPEEGYGVTWVPSMRMVVDTGAPDDARWINLTGNSGHAFHPNYSDMAPLWAANETVPWPGSPEAVEDAAVATLELVP
jgi:penicillin amidase